MDLHCFQDFLPIMAEKLGGRVLMEELRKGFSLLCDSSTGTITLASLKAKARQLNLRGMSDEDLEEMIQEGDLDGDGAMNEYEFCVLMIRMSPCLMERAEELLEEALGDGEEVMMEQPW